MGAQFNYPPTIAPMPLVVTLALAPTTLPANTPVQIFISNPDRRYLFLQNTGTGSVTFGIDNTVLPGAGFINLDPSSTGIQGGATEYKEIIPGNAIWAISAAGTTITAAQG